MRMMILLVTCFISLYYEAQSQVLPTNKTADSTNYFIENKGQWPDEVLFLARIGGLDTWITKDGVVYDFYKLIPSESDQKNSGLDFSKYQKDEYRKEGHVLKTTYSGCNSTSAKGLGQSVCKPYYNYFIGNDSSKWASNVQLFQSAVVKDIYPQIDIHYYFSEGSIRHDFIINPGADPSNIQMVIKGSNSININENNELVYQTSIGEVKSAKVFAFQIIDGQKTQVECRFIKTKNGYGFQIGNYNRNEELIIDPLIWSTFIGSNGTEDRVLDMKLNSIDNVIIIGSTLGSSYPTSVGAYSTTYIGLGDGFISMLGNNGTNLLFSTFIGGSSSENITGLFIDEDRGIYCTGYSQSSDFPTTAGVFGSSHLGQDDVIAFRISNNGTNLDFSTFFGGSSNQESGYDIAVDSLGKIFITGFTQSSEFPTTAGAYDVIQNGSGISDAFVAKFNSNASVLEYCTFIGGSNGDVGNCLLLLNNNELLVTGLTISTDFPTIGAYDASANGISDIFVTKLNISTSSLVFSTYIGGSDEDQPWAMGLDGSLIVVAGHTLSADFPTTSGAFNQTFNGGLSDGYILKLDSSGANLANSTYFGGSNDDLVFDLYVNGAGFSYIVGNTSSSDFPTSSSAYDLTFNGVVDGFVLAMSPDLSFVGYSTYIGGSASDFTGEIEMANNGDLVVAGGSKSSNFPVTVGAYDQTINGAGIEDVIVFKLGICVSPNTALDVAIPVCEGGSIYLTENGGEGSAWIWSGPNGFTDDVQNPIINNVLSEDSGYYYVEVYDSLGCSSLDSIFVAVQSSPTVSILGSSEICYGDSITIAGDGAVSYNWNTTETTPSIFIFPTTTTTYSVTGSNGICTGTASFTVTVLSSPNIVISGDSVICPGTSATLSATGGISYYWSTGENSSSISVNPSSSAYYFVVVSDGTCTGSDTVFVDLYPEVMADAGTDTTISEGESVILTPSGGIVYEWSPDVYLSCTLCENPISTPQTSITYTVLVTDANGCSKTDSVVIIVKGENDCGEIFIPTAFTPNNDGNNDDFKVLGNCIATIHLEVYDRWGGIVFKSDDPIESWKGDKDGSQLNGGIYTYIYIGTLTDGTPISGDGKVNMIK